MQLNRSKTSNKFCGPSALALLTGRHVDDTAHALRIATGKRAIKGVGNAGMLKALDLMGYTALPVPLGTIIVPLGAIGKRPKYATLAATLRTRLKGANKDQAYLVTITGHYIVVKGRRMWDNKHPDGIYLGECPYRRRRVRSIYAVSPSREGK